ncbi:MAG UNVERIFIED_CONTAM: hypothetical protein LVR18_47420 [Planctomycetaceae bacterium]
MRKSDELPDAAPIVRTVPDAIPDASSSLNPQDYRLLPTTANKPVHAQDPQTNATTLFAGGHCASHRNARHTPSCCNMTTPEEPESELAYIRESIRG